MTAAQTGTPTTTPVRVLVAEDSPLNLQVALKQLERLGFPGDGVADGTKAVAASLRTDYAIILMDCQMPEMNGYEATWQIRERERQMTKHGVPAKPIYIIAMTANARADTRDRCLEAGMDDYIQKPVELPALEAALHRALLGPGAHDALEKVIDPVVIAGLRQLAAPGKPGPLGELVDLFLQEAPVQIETIATAVAQNDASSLARVFRAAAALKGAAANLGARNLAALCDEMEQTARVWSLADVAPLLERAQQELASVRGALTQLKQNENIHAG
jgi:CheY-like chemotaxis protein